MLHFVGAIKARQRAKASKEVWWVKAWREEEDNAPPAEDSNECENVRDKTAFEEENLDAREEEGDAAKIPRKNKRGMNLSKVSSQRASVARFSNCGRIPDDKLESVLAGYFPDTNEVQTAAYAGFSDVDDARRWFLTPGMFTAWVIFYRLGGFSNNAMWPRIHGELKRFVEQTLPDWQDDKPGLDTLIKNNLTIILNKLAPVTDMSIDLSEKVKGDAEQKVNLKAVLPWLLCYLVHKVDDFWSLPSHYRQGAYDQHVKAMSEK